MSQPHAQLTSPPNFRRNAPGTATQLLATDNSNNVSDATSPVKQQQQVSPPGSVTSASSSSTTAASSTRLQHASSSSCPDSPIRRVSSSLKNSALDFASRFFNKCKAATFTVDGATYTIVASTPENLPKRDEPSGTGINCGSAVTGGGGAAATTTTSAGNSSERRVGAAGVAGSSGGVCSVAGGETDDRSRQLANSPTGSGSDGNGPIPGIASATINGQVARHGSLTIVRRSNSRKNFTQLDAQQSILVSPSPTNITTATAFQQQQQQQQQLQTVVLNDPSTFSNVITKTTSSVNTKTTYSNRSKEFSSSNLQQHTSSSTVATEATPLLSHDKPFFVAPSSAQTPRQSVTSAAATRLNTNTPTMLPSSPSSYNPTVAEGCESASSIDEITNSASESAPPTARDEGDSVEETDTLTEAAANQQRRTTVASVASSSQSVDLATENLPAVDTPDACDKAAVRLRCLLRLLNNGEISAEILQKNLHYAARVLEAVFLDESKRPSADDSNLGQNPSASSCEREDQTQSSKDQQTKQRCNGNSDCKCKNQTCGQENNNSSCSSLHNDNQPQQQQAVSLNQTASIESRTKGVSLAPQTHSGPTGPPSDAATTSTTETIEEAETASVAADSSGSGSGPSVTGSDVSSKEAAATAARQKRLRTPVWARTSTTTTMTTTTNKTYLNANSEAAYRRFLRIRTNSLL